MRCAVTMKYPIKAFTLLCAFPLLAQDPPKVAGQDLPKVSGPLSGTRPLADRGRSFGDSSVELLIRRTARQNSVPCVAAPPGDVSIEHWVGPPAGWIAYRVDAGPMETVKARLRGDHEAWFSVKAVTKWGELGEGMLQNRIPTGNPEASFINRKPVPVTFFFVVDTTTSLSGKEPYTLTLTRVPTGSAKR